MGLVLQLVILHLWLVLLMSGRMQLMLDVLLGLKQVLLQLLGCILHLKLLWLAMHLHLKLLTERLELLHVMVINGDGLMWHRLLCHLVKGLAHMIMMIHGMLMHLHTHPNTYVRFRLLHKHAVLAATLPTSPVSHVRVQDLAGGALACAQHQAMQGDQSLQKGSSVGSQA